MSQELFAQRRARLLAAIGNGIAIVPAARHSHRNADVTYDFRQDSDFFYLTGFDEPESVAVFNGASANEKYTLFVRPRDPEREQWDGFRAGVDGAKKDFGADGAYPLAELDQKLRDWARGCDTLYFSFNTAMDQRAMKVWNQTRNYSSRRGGGRIQQARDLRDVLHEMRLIKTPDEIKIMRTACEITRDAHHEGMRVTKPGLWEWQVQAVIEGEFRRRGSPRNGYGSIVAGGGNACVLHYVENTAQLKDGDLLCVDAGAEYGYYSADITRTWPINGKFSAPQREIYELVLKAEEAAIALCKPGNTMHQVHEETKRVLTEGLVALKLLPRSVEDSLAMHHYREFFMHGTGHYLGMDVHDVGRYRNVDGARPFEPGMVVTIEPGLYFMPSKAEVKFPLRTFTDDEQAERRFLLGMEKARKLEEEEAKKAEQVEMKVPAQYLGIGIRIEDDILITENGHENLTAGCPKTIDEVEAACAEPPRAPIA